MKLTQLQESKHTSGTLRLRGTLTAGRKLQFKENIIVVIDNCGEKDEEYDWCAVRECTLVDFEGGMLAFRYLASNVPVQFVEERGKWSMTPRDGGGSNWIIVQR